MSHLAATAIRNTFFGKDVAHKGRQAVLDSASDDEDSNAAADYAAIDAPIDQDGYYTEITIPLTLATLTALDRDDLKKIMGPGSYSSN
jgi:hypothetical protein